MVTMSCPSKADAADTVNTSTAEQGPSPTPTAVIDIQLPGSHVLDGIQHELQSTSDELPIHIICYYKETDEVRLSMGVFNKAFNPLVIAVCENVPPPSNPCSVLTEYFVGPCIGPGFNIGHHRDSGALFILYVKTPGEPKGKRFSHSIGARIVKKLLRNQINGVMCLFQDADTQSCPSTLKKMTQKASLKCSDMVGCRQTDYNINPLSTIGSYNFFSDMFCLTHCETLIFGKAESITGCYVFLRLTAYFEFERVLCKSTGDMNLYERASYLTEDTLLTCMMAGTGKQIDYTLSDVSWNLPRTYEELMKQRRRWYNGRLSTDLVSKRFMKCGVKSILFDIWFVFIFLRDKIIPDPPIRWILTLYHYGNLMYFYQSWIFWVLLIPMIVHVTLMGFVSIVFFNCNPDGREKMFMIVANLYCMNSMLVYPLTALYLYEDGTFLFSNLMRVAVYMYTLHSMFEILIALQCSKGGMIFTFKVLVSHQVWSRPLIYFIRDYSLATFLDNSWGVRETNADRENHDVGACGKKASLRSLHWERTIQIAMILTMQVIIPGAVVALSFVLNESIVPLLICVNICPDLIDNVTRFVSCSIDLCSHVCSEPTKECEDEEKETAKYPLLTHDKSLC